MSKVSRILFADPSIRPHVTLTEMRNDVIEDIHTRYRVGVREVIESDEILLDPGGPARFRDIEYVEFKLRGILFKIQTMHVPLAQIVLAEHFKIQGEYVRIYFAYDLLVLPLAMHWPLTSSIEFNQEAGLRARKELQQIFADAYAMQRADPNFEA